MKKLSDYKNEEALDVLGDIIAPVAFIFADEEVSRKLEESILLAIQHVLKFHKKNVMIILARLNEMTLEEYECTPYTVAKDLLDIANDQDMLNFFASQGLKINAESSGSAMANIEDEHLEDSSNT